MKASDASDLHKNFSDVCAFFLLISARSRGIIYSESEGKRKIPSRKKINLDKIQNLCYNIYRKFERGYV